MLDPKAVAFTRIWCDFELYKTIRDKNKRLDVMTSREGKPLLLSDGLLPRETVNEKMHRERHFPIPLLVRGLQCVLENGQASVEADKQNILRSISNDGGGGPGALERSLQHANEALRSHFAVASWPQAVLRGLVENFDKEAPGEVSLPLVLRKDATRSHLILSLAHGGSEESVVSDRDVRAVASGLPEQLELLDLSFEGCHRISDAGVTVLAKGLPQQLTYLSLDFSACDALTDESLAVIAKCLPQSLQHLNLCFAHCQLITILGAQALAAALPPKLKQFSATFVGTAIDRKYTNIKKFQSIASQSPSTLKKFAGVLKRSVTARGPSPESHEF